MELAKQPVTELEYWEAIESLGGYIYNTRRWLGRGDIADIDNSTEKSIAEALAIQSRLAEELVEKFGVILSDKSSVAAVPAPVGKIYYLDWYRKFEREYSLIKYNQLLCSACPFSDGFESFISGHRVTCHFQVDGLREFKFHHIYLCPIVEHSGFNDYELTLKDIREQILKDFGQEAYDLFLVKEQEIGSRVSNNQLEG